MNYCELRELKDYCGPSYLGLGCKLQAQAKNENLDGVWCGQPATSNERAMMNDEDPAPRLLVFSGGYDFELKKLTRDERFCPLDTKVDLDRVGKKSLEIERERFPRWNCSTWKPSLWCRLWYKVHINTSTVAPAASAKPDPSE